jgi:hypothetical protein
MKPVVFAVSAVLVAPLVLGACEKSDNINQLHQEAVATVKSYAPRVDELDKRRQSIFQRGRNVPGNQPDVPEVIRLINEAGDKINEMKGITGSLEKQADEAAKANKADELEKLVDESSEKLEADFTIANEDMTHVEGWLWQYEQHRGLVPPPAPATPLPTPNTTGEPPPAAAGSGAGSAESAAKGDQKQPAEKAAEKAATEKADKGAPKAPADKAKAADKTAPKAAAPKAAAPKAAAPKAAGSGAGSAAK